MKKITNLPKDLAVFFIRIYQTTLSPDHGPIFRNSYPYGFCRFYPSCSQYAKEAIKKFGVIKGSTLSIKRFLKCNPWTEPRVDKV